MWYLYLKAVHIIFVVSWMAGLFYGVRLFIYHTEANTKPAPDRRILTTQFAIIEKRLWYIIATPAMILTVLSGAYMAIDMHWYKMPWMMVKFGFVILLLVYHFLCQRIMNQLAAGVYKWTSNQLRVWNEVATILLVAIVFTVILKSAVNWIYGLIGLILFAVVIMTAVKIYKRYRVKNNQ